MTGEVQWAFCYDHTVLQGLSLNWAATVSSAGLEGMLALLWPETKMPFKWKGIYKKEPSKGHVHARHSHTAQNGYRGISCKCTCYSFLAPCPVNTQNTACVSVRLHPGLLLWLQSHLILQRGLGWGGMVFFASLGWGWAGRDQPGLNQAKHNVKSFLWIHFVCPFHLCSGICMCYVRLSVIKCFSLWHWLSLLLFFCHAVSIAFSIAVVRDR